jgi:HEAT repeats
MRSSSIIGAILLALFGLPFLAMGLFFAFASASRGGPQAWFGVVFGLFFACIGVALIGASIVGVRISKQQEELKAANPEKPWLWRTDWAEGRANGGDPRANITAWVFTGFWNLVSIFVSFNVLPKAMTNGDPKSLLVLVFPLVGVFITALALRGTLRIWRYGRTSFQCATVPFFPGGHLQGAIHLKLPSSIPHGIDLRLSCKRRIVTGSGKSQTVNEIVLWQDEKNIPAESVTRGFTEAEIPVDFAIPPDAYETNGDNPNDRVYWQLHARADVPGVDFIDNYELPVFRTEARPRAAHQFVSSENSSESIAANPEKECAAPAPASTHVVFREDTEGTSFYFPPLRNHGQALGVVVFATIWSAVVYFLWTHEGAPWLFRIGFSLCEILVGYMLLSVVFGSALIRVREGMLQVRRTILGLGALQQIPFSEITSISPLSQGQANTSGEVLYGISINRSDGREIKIAASSLTQVEARWIVSSIERAMGRKQDTHVEFRSMYGPPPQSSASAGFARAASSTTLPLKFRTAHKSVGVAGFAIWLAFAGFMFARVFSGVKTVHRAPPSKAEPRLSIPTGPMTDEDAARIGGLPTQQKAEELLARSIGHDNRALDMLDNDVESWTSEVKLTDRVKQLDARAAYSTDLRVRRADADLWLAMEGWHRNHEAVELLIKRIDQDQQYRPSACYFLGMEGARGVDSEHAFAVLRDRAINDSDPLVRQWAVEGLRFFKTDDALDVLFHSFTSDSNYSVRDRAGCNLSDCGIFTRAQRMRVVPKLVEVAEDRRLNSQMRNWTFMALREITDVSLPDNASAWRGWYKEHGADKTAEFEALPWYQVRGDQ